MKTKQLLTIFTIISFTSGLSIGRVKAQSALDNYINAGLKNNIVVQQKNIALDKAINALKEAKTYFLPSFNFNGTYTSGEGGRNIPLPIGDLLDPVYGTLNKLTQTNEFPQISNESINFFPTNFYDAKVRTSLAVYNSDLYYNKDIKKQQVQLQEYEVGTYKRDLVKDIKVAYYNYLMALSSEQIYQSAEGLVNKNVEVNESLLKNGKGLPASVLRAESEAETIKNQILEAKNNATNAMHYFNFLLNKKQDETIDTSINKQLALSEVNKYIDQENISAREELKMAALGEGIYFNAYQMNKQFWQPKVSAFLDLGSQASDWAFNSQSKYYLVGAQVDIPIFNWFKNDYKTNEAQADYQSASLNTKYITEELQLSADVAKNSLSTAYSAYQTALKQLSSAQSYFNLIEKGIKEGVNSQIEFIDARNQLTVSQISVNINLYKVLQAMADVERETATYQLQK